MGANAPRSLERDFLIEHARLQGVEFTCRNTFWGRSRVESVTFRNASLRAEDVKEYLSKTRVREIRLYDVDCSRDAIRELLLCPHLKTLEISDNDLVEIYGDVGHNRARYLAELDARVDE